MKTVPVEPLPGRVELARRTPVSRPLTRPGGSPAIER